MKYLLISMIAWLTALTCYAQDGIKKNALSLNIGPGFLMRQDNIFSPFIHTDFSILNLGLDYTREAKLSQKISLRYGNFNPMVAKPYDYAIHGEINTAYPHNFNFVDINYLIGKQVKNTDKSALTVGGFFTADIQAMSYVYGRISSLGYYSVFGPGIFGKYDITISEKSKITTTLQFPLIAWLARSPYLVNDDEFIENISSHSVSKTFLAFVGDGELVTWNRLQTFDLEMKYAYSLNKKWDLGAAYWFEFIHAGQPRNLLSFRNSFNLSSTFRF